MPQETCLVSSVFGTIRAYENDLITDQIRQFGNHTRPEFAFATALLGPGMSCVDVGAHIGTFTLLAQQKVGEAGRVLAVEALQSSYEILQENLHRRSAGNVEALNALIGNPETRYEIASIDRNSGATYFAEVQQADAQVPVLSLDQLLERAGHVDFLKMDIEGLEFEALSKSSRLARDRFFLYFEVSEEQLGRHGASIAMVNELLRGLRYQFFVNVGDRNAPHDVFRVKQLNHLTQHKPFFDVLCVPEEHAFAGVLRRAGRHEP